MIRLTFIELLIGQDFRSTQKSYHFYCNYIPIVIISITSEEGMPMCFLEITGLSLPFSLFPAEDIANSMDG